MSGFEAKCADLNEQLKNMTAKWVARGEEVDTLASELEVVQRAVDAAYAAMRGSEYVGGPTERDAWRTAVVALGEVATQHHGQGP
jgi:hypothetical protein